MDLSPTACVRLNTRHEPSRLYQSYKNKRIIMMMTGRSFFVLMNTDTWLKFVFILHSLV
jgi:hypothetical protein